LGCLESMVRYFNAYAFTQVAVYGKTYCDAAKATWQLLSARGFDMLINDNLVGGVLWMGVMLVTIFTLGVGIILARAAWNFGSDTWFFLLAAFFMGLIIAIVAMEVIESCVCALFVCFAEDPEVLNRTKPDDHKRLNGAFNERLGVLRREQTEREAAQRDGQ